MSMRSARRGARAAGADRDDRLSRFLALVLRHKPESVGVTLDPGGFVEVETLAAALAAQPGWAWVTAEAIRRLAAADGRRYEIAAGRVRARYGHTVAIDAPGTPVIPPEWLYHGIAAEAVERLRREGLQPQDRQFVHLSATRPDALAVARRRHPDAVVVTVLARRASEAGVRFFQASAGIYLTRAVPPQFLHLPRQDDGA